MIHPVSLDPSTTRLQVVDGNNLVMARLYRDLESFSGVRGLLEEVRACRSPLIVVFDGAHARRRRLDIFPAYKSRRTDRFSESIQSGLGLVRELLAFTASVTVCVPGWEGDDVVATLARHSAAQGQAVRVVSEDQDFAQLGTDPLIETTASCPHAAPAYVHAYKALVGDPSDSIPGLRGFGKTGWAKCNQERVAAFLQEHDGQLPASGVPATLGLPSRATAWWEEHPEEVHQYWRVTSLWEVPAEAMAGCVGAGAPNPAAIEALLSRFML